MYATLRHCALGVVQMSIEKKRWICNFEILRLFWAGQYDSWVTTYLLNTVYLLRKCLQMNLSRDRITATYSLCTVLIFFFKWSFVVCISSHVWGIPGCFVKTVVCVCIPMWSEPNLIITVISPLCEISMVLTVGMTELYCH